MGNTPTYSGNRVQAPADVFEVLTAGQTVRFAKCEIDGPTLQYVTVDDQLIVQAFSSQAGQAFNVNVRFAFPDGRVVPFQYTFTVTTARTLQIFSEPMAEGYILSIAVSPAVALATGTYLYANVGLKRGTANAQNSYQVLCAGYSTNNSPVTFPWQIPVPPTSGAGALRSITNGAPGAGADWTITVPAGVRWQVICGTYQLTTDAVAANRVPRVQFTDGTNILFEGDAGSVQVASNAYRYSLGPGVGTTEADFSSRFIPLPVPMLLSGGYIIKSSTNSIDPADQYSAQQLSVLEWADAL